MEPKSVLDQLGDLNPEAYLFDNMDSALIGIGYRAHKDPVAVYSQSLIFSRLHADGLSEEDAAEYFTGKFIGIWAGDNTPIILYDMTE